MSGHYCTEHETVFFKKGKMKGYAHPVEGTEPTEWCNEPEEGGVPVPEEVKAKIDEAVNPQELPAVDFDKVKDRDGMPLSVKIRTFCISYAKDMGVGKIAAGKETSALTIIGTAKMFEKYVITGDYKE